MCKGVVTQAEVAAYRKRVNPVSTATASGRRTSAARDTLARCIRSHAGLWKWVGRREAADAGEVNNTGRFRRTSPTKGRKEHQWRILMSNSNTCCAGETPRVPSLRCRCKDGHG